jgi:hypothetical protein
MSKTDKSHDKSRLGLSVAGQKFEPGNPQRKTQNYSCLRFAIKQYLFSKNRGSRGG